MPLKGGEANERQSPREAAHYIAVLTRELARIARRHRMDGLAYVLDIAHMEAEQIAERSPGGGGRTA